MKELRYFIDPATGQPHIYNHNVDESEVEEVLRRPRKHQPGGENSRIALGQTSAGRFLKVIYSEDQEDAGLFVITAYDLRGKALAALRRRLRR